jgi:hypothetical protein
MDTITKFNSWEDKCILLINTVQNTGINVLAEALVLPDAGTTNSIRITQTVGRIVRTNNPVDNVHIYLCAKDEQAFIRCHYARCYYNEEWRYPFNTLPNLDYLKKCLSIMNLFGTTVDVVDSVDGCVIFADVGMLEDTREVVEWWSKNRTKKSVLVKEQVTRLMCL